MEFGDVGCQRKKYVDTDSEIVTETHIVVLAGGQ